MKLLQERLKRCYMREGVNHHEHCKDLVTALMARIKAPYFGMAKAPSTEW